MRVDFIVGASDPDTVDNLDVLMTLPDGSRWSATVLTLDEVGRVMDRWRKTGECLGGSYFDCPDLLIVREPGIEALARVLEDILAEGGPEGSLQRIEEPELDPDDEH